MVAETLVLRFSDRVWTVTPAAAESLMASARSVLGDVDVELLGVDVTDTPRMLAADLAPPCRCMECAL